MHNWIKCLGPLFLSALVCFNANASAYTHFWTIDRTPDGIGLVGIYDGPGSARTQVNYGGGPLDHFWIPFHIYWVVSIANLPILVGLAFYLFRRYHRRHANAA